MMKMVEFPNGLTLGHNDTVTVTYDVYPDADHPVWLDWPAEHRRLLLDCLEKSEALASRVRQHA